MTVFSLVEEVFISSGLRKNFETGSLFLIRIIYFKIINVKGLHSFLFS